MLDKQQKLDVTQEELAVIEAALETQAKILTIQSSAGGSGSRRRLNETKKVLARVSQQVDDKNKSRARRVFRWFGLARTTN